MTMHTLTGCGLAATLALASCKSDDEPEQPEKTNVESALEDARAP
jgi:hypothetical protein